MKQFKNIKKNQYTFNKQMQVQFDSGVHCLPCNTNRSSGKKCQT